MEEKNVELLERLSILANIMQVGSFVMNVEQLSNDDLMKELRVQNERYLENLIKKENEIISKLNEVLERLDKLEKI